MDRNKIEEIIEKLQTSFNKYHKLFLDNYPLFSRKEYDFGSRDMNDLGIECQSYLSMLGSTAKARMNHIGFNQLFAFDNEVDWFSWQRWINKNKIDHTQYLSVSLRIETELKRMRFFLKEDMWEAYCNLEKDEYSVSYLNYEDFQSEVVEVPECGVQTVDSMNHSNIHVVVNNHLEKLEKEVFSNIESFEKKTSIMANIATFIARISGIKI